jgi:hypothetical protein
MTKDEIWLEKTLDEIEAQMRQNNLEGLKQL